METIKKMLSGASIAKLASGYNNLQQMYIGFENRSGIVSSAASGNATGAGTEIMRRHSKATQSKISQGMDSATAGFATAGAWATQLGQQGKVISGVMLGLAGLTQIIKPLANTFATAEQEIKANQMDTRRTAADVFLSNYQGRQANKLLQQHEGYSLIDWSNRMGGHAVGLTADDFTNFQSDYAKRAGGRESYSGTLSALKAAYNTGTDRESMLGLNAMFGRYGVPMKNGKLNNDGWAVNSAYGGNRAMGGNNATLEEFTRAMQRVFSDGMSKSIVRTSDSVAKQISAASNWLGKADSSGYYRNSENVANTLGRMGGAAAASQDVGNAAQMTMYRMAGKYVNENGDEATSILKGMGYSDKAIAGMKPSDKARLVLESGGAAVQKITGMASAHWMGQGDAGYAADNLRQLGMAGSYTEAYKMALSGGYTGTGGGAMALPEREKTTADALIAGNNEVKNSTVEAGWDVIERAANDFKESVSLLQEDFTQIGSLALSLNGVVGVMKSAMNQ
jgi:hypothetical protein